MPPTPNLTSFSGWIVAPCACGVVACVTFSDCPAFPITSRKRGDAFLDGLSHIASDVFRCVNYFCYQTIKDKGIAGQGGTL